MGSEIGKIHFLRFRKHLKLLCLGTAVLHLFLGNFTKLN